MSLTWSQTPKTGFLVMWLISELVDEALDKTILCHSISILFILKDKLSHLNYFLTVHVILNECFLQDKSLRLNELNALRKQIEREYLEKVKLEDDIMEKMRSQLTMDKAAQYTKKLTGKKRELTKQLVSFITVSISLHVI